MAEENSRFNDGLEWRNAGNTAQTYQYPEDLQDRTDPRCNFCGKTSYRAETTTYNKIPYHKDCFKCVKCNKKLTPGDANPFGDDSYLCNVHFQQVIRSGGGNKSNGQEVFNSMSNEPKQKGPSLVTATGAKENIIDLEPGRVWRKETSGKQVYRFPEDLEGPDARTDPRCHKCGKTSYRAETLTYNRVPYHKKCFKCLQCKKKMNAGGATPWGEDTLLCTTHFNQAVSGMRGAKGQDVVTSSSAEPKQTGPSTVVSHRGGRSDNPDFDLEAGLAWRKETRGKQVYNYPEDTESRADPRCHKCGKTAYRAETVTYNRIPYHKDCFKCLKCKKRLNAGDATPFGNEDFLCSPHYKQAILGTSGHAGDDVVTADSAEQKQTGPSTVTATVAADSVDISEGLEWRKQGGKQFYKYADEETTGPNRKCNKCGKTTYPAESVTYNRIPYHKNCLKCVKCKRKLTAGDANPFGEDTYLCNIHFQQVVFGGGQKTADTVSADSAQTAPTGPSTISGTTSRLDAESIALINEGFEWRENGGKQIYEFIDDMGTRANPRCNLCAKTVYPAECVTYEKIPFHLKCFRCVQCRKKLTAGSANPFGVKRFLCDAHFMQIALGRKKGGFEAVETVSAESQMEENAGPSSVGGGGRRRRKKCSYKPPTRR